MSNKKTTIDKSLTKISTTTTTKVNLNKNEELLDDTDLKTTSSSDETKITVPIVQVINIQNIATTAALSNYNKNNNTTSNDIYSSSPLSSSNEVEDLAEGNL
jgi:hypothetical protein